MKNILISFSFLFVFGINILHASEDDLCCSSLRSSYRSTPKSTSEDLDDERPKDHYCPISHEIFIDPVIAADGYTYERASIEQWIKQTSDRGIIPPNSPMTGAPLENNNLISNFALRSLVNEWKSGDKPEKQTDDGVCKISCKSPFSS